MQRLYEEIRYQVGHSETKHNSCARKREGSPNGLMSSGICVNHIFGKEEVCKLFDCTVEISRATHFLRSVENHSAK